MQITLLHKHLSKAEESFFNEYIAQKTDAIEHLLTKFATDAPMLKVSIEKFEKHDAFSVEFLLKLPAKSLVSKEASHSINKAVDLSKDRLVSQVKKHMAHLRKDRSHQTIRSTEVNKKELKVKL